MKRLVTMLAALSAVAGAGCGGTDEAGTPAVGATAGGASARGEAPVELDGAGDAHRAGAKASAAAGGACEPPNLPPGPCVYEVTLDGLEVTDKQGISDGNLELEVDATMTAKGGSGAVHWTKDKAKEDIPYTVNGAVGTFSVPRGKSDTIKLCHTTTELDGGGSNGRSDVAEECTSMVVSCPGTRTATAGTTTDFCKGNKHDDTGACKNLNGTVKLDWTVRLVDADADGVANGDDFTPDPCDEQTLGEEHQASGGRASIVYFHMGDGDLNTLAQHVGTNLEKAMVGYEYVVLLVDDVNFLGLTLSADALKTANLVLSPTRDNFFEAFRDISARGYDADVYLWSHGNLDGKGGATFKTIEPGVVVDSEDIETRLDPAVTGAHTVPIRMVYSTACYHGALDDSWGRVGAKAATGTVGIDFYPVVYGNFVDDWNAGSTFGVGLSQQFEPASMAIAEGFQLLQGSAAIAGGAFASELPAGCKVADSVLAQNACAKWYFDDGAGDQPGYNMGPGEYNPVASGLDNMRAASTFLLGGAANVTKFGPINY